MTRDGVHGSRGSSRDGGVAGCLRREEEGKVVSDLVEGERRFAGANDGLCLGRDLKKLAETSGMMDEAAGNSR